MHSGSPGDSERQSEVDYTTTFKIPLGSNHRSTVTTNLRIQFKSITQKKANLSTLFGSRRLFTNLMYFLEQCFSTGVP